MIGLLYQDFLRVKGRLILFVLLGQFLVFTLLELLTADDPVNAYMLIVFFITVIILAFLFISSYLETSLMKGVDTAKDVRYYLSLPLSKQDYVAEKYVFLLITMWTFGAFFTFEILFLQMVPDKVTPGLTAAMGNTSGVSAASLATVLLPTVFLFMLSLTLFICAVELPFYFRFGAEQGKAVKSALIILLAFAAFVYAMFGDLSIFDHWDIFALMDYLQAHPDFNFLLNVLPPILCGVLYWGSYKLSVKVFITKE